MGVPEFLVFRCRTCEGYALGGPEEVVHLKNTCPGRRDVERIDRLTVLAVAAKPCRELDLLAPA